MRNLAARGAQIVLLTQHPLNDYFLVEYITDLRSKTGNELITAEQCDLSSLHSIRLFATKWIDNAPPRRLDMIILCANVRLPTGAKLTWTEDNLEATIAVNYLANFHLLSILSPAIRAQPPDRQVRIIMGSCSTNLHMLGLVSSETSVISTALATHSGKAKEKVTSARGHPLVANFSPRASFARSQFALATFASAFQKHLNSYARPDKLLPNLRVLLVDPGWTRTPGMQRFLTFGSLWGLLIYLVMWPLWWLILKSPEQGAQSFLTAAMEANVGDGIDVRLLKECREISLPRKEVLDEEVQKKLWKESEAIIESAEKDSAMKRVQSTKKGDKTAATANGVKSKDRNAASQTGSTRLRK